MPRPKILQDILDINSKLSTDFLTHKYYQPESTISVIDSTVVTTNPLPTTWSGSGLVYTNGGYQIEGNVNPSGANPLTNAFDNNNSTSYAVTGALEEGRAHVIITLPSAITVTSFKTYIAGTGVANEISILGSNDKSNWDTLFTSNSYDSGLSEKFLTSTGSYRYYKINLFSSDSMSIINVREIQIGGYRIITNSNSLVLTEVPNPLSVNQRIMIRTPSFDSTGVTVNTFNNKSIDAVLLPDRFYELIYDGTKYLAKEVV